jgi:hypothetical protein
MFEVTSRYNRSPEQKSRFQPSCMMKSGMQRTSGVDLRISQFEKMTVFFKNAAWLTCQIKRPDRVHALFRARRGPGLGRSDSDSDGPFAPDS